MASGSEIIITYDGQDITSHVMFSSASFEAQINAMPGSFEFTCVDRSQSLEPFITGKIVTLDVDGQRLFGGYLTHASRVFAFPVVDTAKEVTARMWKLRGTDFNVLFDKRILRNPANYLEHLPQFAGNRKDGWLIDYMCTHYLDVPAYINHELVSNGGRIENVICPGSVGEDYEDPTCDSSEKVDWMQQGTVWRKQMEDFAQWSGARWYIDADGYVNFHGLETSEARWGFSDIPNHNEVTSTPVYFQGATIGFREINATEDGGYMVNDALIWGGSSWADQGSVVFARKQNEESQNAHNRWQYAETRFEELGTQQQVKVRAAVIVNGKPGEVGGDTMRGLRYAQWSVELTWFSHDVPEISGIRDHLKPGQLVTIVLNTFGDGEDPLILTLPLRQIRMSFPTLDSQNDGDAYISFVGTFSLQLEDPWTIWRYLLKQRNAIVATVTSTVSQADNDTVDPLPGSTYYDSPPDQLADGSRTVFHIPYAYVEGTTRIWLNGLSQSRSTYTESDPDVGEITFDTAPATGTTILIECKLV